MQDHNRFFGENYMSVYTSQVLEFAEATLRVRLTESVPNTSVQ